MNCLTVNWLYRSVFFWQSALKMYYLSFCVGSMYCYLLHMICTFIEQGDGIVRAYEVAEEYPHLFPLSDYKADGLHQALSFLPKTEVDVRKVEFSRAFRLTSNSIEPISFTVPRTKVRMFKWIWRIWQKILTSGFIIIHDGCIWVAMGLNEWSLFDIE